ncbi:MAG: hypothetical protein AAGF53_07270 [Pseudomonadota bacterium]
MSAVLLLGCTGSADSDALELFNTFDGNVVPKSSPTAFVSAFDTFCVKGPESVEGVDKALREVSYVPTRTANGTLLYVVDDSRPAIAISEQSCSVRALSRTGQTDRVKNYMAENFPEAKQLTPAAFGKDVEQVWEVGAPRPGAIVTTRTIELGTTTSYTLIFLRQKSAEAT